MHDTSYNEGAPSTSLRYLITIFIRHCGLFRRFASSFRPAQNFKLWIATFPTHIPYLSHTYFTPFNKTPQTDAENS